MLGGVAAELPLSCVRGRIYLGGGSAGGICLDRKLIANVVEPRQRDHACEFMILDLFRSGYQHAEIICWAYGRHVSLFDTVIVMV